MNNAAAIRSAIPGRERWQIGPLRYEPSYAVAIERELSRHAPVRYAWANPLTGRLLLQYDPGVQPEEVRDRLYASLDAAPATDDELTAWRTTWPQGFNRSLEQLAVEQARIRLVLSAGLFTGVLAKRAILGTGMFAGSPLWLQASAIMTIISGYAALRRGFNALITAGGFSSTTILEAPTLGHALKRGILFRDPQVLSSQETPTFAVIGRSSADEIKRADVLLIDDDPERLDYAKALIARTSRIVGQDEWGSRLVGIAGFIAAAAGKMTASQASRLHNSTRLVMELNSLRLVTSSQ